MAIYSARHSSVGRTTHAAGTAAAHVGYITRDGAAREVVGERMPTDPADAMTWLNEQETAERKNGRVIDKLMVALPKELTPNQRVELVRDFAELATQGRAPWIAGIHDKGKDAGNPHAHLVIRDKDPETGRRVAGLSEKGSTERLREMWETMANQALEKAGQAARIDRRSLAAQGIDRVAQIHEGPASRAMRERGESPPSQDRQDRRGRTIRYSEIDQGTRSEFNAQIIALNEARGRLRHANENRPGPGQGRGDEFDRDAGGDRPADRDAGTDRRPDRASGHGQDRGARRPSVRPGHRPERQRGEDQRRPDGTARPTGDDRAPASPAGLGSPGNLAPGDPADRVLRDFDSWRDDPYRKWDGKHLDLEPTDQPTIGRGREEDRGQAGPEARPEEAVRRLNYWLVVADKAKDMQRRLDALQRAQERAEVLERIIGSHAPKAREIAEEKHQAQEVGAEADAARQGFREWLGQTYRDPAAAEQAWQKSCGEKGLKRTMREVGRNPERLGPLQGWRVWVFASAERREAERYAAGLVKRGAEARVLGGKAGAARTRLHQLGRQERDDPGMREYAHAQGELGQRRSSEIGRAVSQAECDLVARWAKETAVVGPGREPGKVTYEWAPALG